MEFVGQVVDLITALSAPDGLSRLFLMLFPFFLLFELPLNLLVMLGVGRGVCPPPTKVAENNQLRPPGWCIINN